MLSRRIPKFDMDTDDEEDIFFAAEPEEEACCQYAATNICVNSSIGRILNEFDISYVWN
jgi:hypothetical protein